MKTNKTFFELPLQSAVCASAIFESVTKEFWLTHADTDIADRNRRAETGVGESSLRDLLCHCPVQGSPSLVNSLRIRRERMNERQREL